MILKKIKNKQSTECVSLKKVMREIGLNVWKVVGWRRFFIVDWWQTFLGIRCRPLPKKWSAVRETLLSQRGKR